MTRINVVPVEELTDNFILAEYYELPRLFPLIEKHIHKVSVLDKPGGALPQEYILGKGHMRFFYNKLAYLYRRHAELLEEGLRRGLDLYVDPNVHVRFQIKLKASSFWYNDYEPTPEAIQLNRDRLQYRRKYDGGLYSPAP